MAKKVKVDSQPKKGLPKSKEFEFVEPVFRKDKSLYGHYADLYGHYQF